MALQHAAKHDGGESFTRWNERSREGALGLAGLA
jgi:hypothetical protein